MRGAGRRRYDRGTVAPATPVPRSRLDRFVHWLSLPDQYLAAIVLILATLFVRAITAPTDPLGGFVGLLLGSATLLFVLWTSRTRAVTFRIFGVLVLVACLGSGIGLLLGGSEAAAAAALVGFALAFVAPLVILRRIVLAPKILFNHVLGALCVYLLLGLMYSYLYALIGVTQGHPFFVQTSNPTSADFLYFSYVTLATVGYGDFTASTSLGRIVAASEGVLGNLYLVSAVALLVGNIGGTLRGDFRKGPRDE